MSTLQAAPGAIAPPPSASTAGGSQLVRNAGTLEVLAQSVAAAAPSVALASVPGGIFLVAGRGALWSIALGTVVVVLVAYTISLQARRTVSAGSLATYTGNGLGPGAAFAAAWGLIIGYGGFAIAALIGGWIYSSSLLGKLGISASSEIVGVILVGIALVAAATSSYRGLRLSARLGLTLEALSLTAIGVVFVATLIHHGLRFDTGQLTAKGATSTNIVLGGVLAVGAFAGFESAASLGLETQHAHRTIARVLLRTVLGLAVLYLISSYTEIIGFAKLTGDSAPLHVVADYAGVDWTSYIVDIGISLSMVAFAAAVLNAGARSLYTLGREGAIPARFASVHPRFGSPYVGVLTLGAIAAAVALVFVFTGTGALRASTYVGTVSSFGYFTAYFLISLATPVWLWRIRALSAGAVVAGLGAAGAMVYVVYKNIVPAPPSPYNLLPSIYGGLLVVGLLFYAVLRVRDPERARQIGTVQELSEDEALRRNATEPLHVGASV